MVKVESQGNRRHIEQALKDLEKKSVKVGWFDTSVYEDGTKVAYVAAIQEFGAPQSSIPARPFMRPTIRDKDTEWKELLAKGMKKVMAGDLTVEQVYGALGQLAAGNISDTISQITDPPLSNITLMLRKMRQLDPDGTTTGRTVGEAAAWAAGEAPVSGVSTKPLVDTGYLIQSISSKVEDV